MEADAIVNTADRDPVIGRGTDYAIHTAAGPELLEARKKIGAISVGRSAATPAFGLPAKHVLHTVSPVWTDGDHGETILLREAYDSALELADSLGCGSVAFPLMAAGTNGFPLDTALSVAVQAFTDWLINHDIRIYLVLFNADAFDIAGSLFDGLKSYIDDNYAKEAAWREYQTYSPPPAGANRKLSVRPVLPGLPKIGKRRKNREKADAGAAQPSVHPNESEAMYTTSLPLEEILRQHEKTFSQYLLDLLRERDGKDSDVYKRAEVSKQLFSKILNNPDYQPTKSTVIQLAIGLELDLAQTQKLLNRAGYSLTRSSKADLVVQYYIEQKIYNVTFINEALYDCGLPLLKTGLRS